MNATDFDPSRYYTKEYFDGSYDDGYRSYGNSADVLRHEFSDSLRHLESFVPQDAAVPKLLELGSAYGYFLEQAADRFDAVGVEISEHAVEECRKKGLQVLAGELTSASDVGDEFDVVALFDCIEHLPDPWETFDEIHRRLAPGGHVILTTGDWNSLYSRVAGKRWRLMTPPQHLFFFSPRSIRIFLNRLGFDLCAIEHPAKRVPLGLVLFQLTRRSGLGLPIPKWSDRLALRINLFDAMRVVARKRVDAK